MRTTSHVHIPAAVRPILQRVGRLAAGLGTPAYAVGGCVRDWLLGVATTDLDVTVEGNGLAVAKATATALGGRLTVHAQFGTATILVAPSGRRLDVASCRTETYAKPAAYPRVSPGRIEDDLFRRDFTINAVAAALDPARLGTLVDPFRGARDLADGRLRILHARSFLDDPSRILRGIRFLHRFGLAWEPATERALREAVAAGSLGWLNPGRLTRELERMQREPDPAACLRTLVALLDARG